MIIIKGDLILKEDFEINDDLKVEGKIICEGGSWNIKARDIEAWDIKALDIEARDIKAGDIEAFNIKAWDIEARNIKALDILYWAVCYARNSFKCKSIKGIIKNYKHFCLNGEIEFIKDGNNYYDKCGSELNQRKNNERENKRMA